jgi:hypothetical protein
MAGRCGFRDEWACVEDEQYIYIFRSAIVNERLKEINFMDCYFCFILLMKASHKI